MTAGKKGRNLNGRDKQREETRQRVFEAALEIFRRDGFHECRIEDIVVLAGVSRGTFYFHFPTKDDVLLEAYQQGLKLMCEQLQAIPDDVPLPGVLEIYCQMVAMSWKVDPRIYPEMGVLALRIEASSRNVRYAGPLRTLLGERIIRGVREDRRPVELAPEVLADFFMVNIFAAAVAWVRNPVGDLEAVLKAATLFFLRGVGYGDV